MKLLLVAVAFFLTTLVAGTPIAIPKPDAAADPFKFYASSGTAVGARKRDLVFTRDEPLPEAFLTKRSILVKRTQSPTSGTYANQCGPTNQGGGISFTCGTGNAGLCCSPVGWCGSDSYYCGGGCQDDYGSCKLPYLQLTYDSDPGDAIWDISTDNVFDAQPGDGMIYYGATPTVSWPSK